MARRTYTNPESLVTREKVDNGLVCPMPYFVDREPKKILREICDAALYVRARRQAYERYPEAFLVDRSFCEDPHAVAYERVSKKGAKGTPDEGSNTLICATNQEVIGAVSYYRPRPGEMLLVDLFALERGKAVGRLLLRAALDVARVTNVQRVQLYVLPKNQRAIDLYSSIGFNACPSPDADPSAAIPMYLQGGDHICSAMTELTRQVYAIHGAVQASEAPSLMHGPRA